MLSSVSHDWIRRITESRIEPRLSNLLLLGKESKTPMRSRDCWRYRRRGWQRRIDSRDVFLSSQGLGGWEKGRKQETPHPYPAAERQRRRVGRKKSSSHQHRSVCGYEHPAEMRGVRCIVQKEIRSREARSLAVGSEVRVGEESHLDLHLIRRLVEMSPSPTLRMKRV